MRNQLVLEQSFYGKLASHIQVIETMGKVKKLEGSCVQCLIKYQASEQILFGWMIIDKSRNFQNYLNLPGSGVIVILLLLKANLRWPRRVTLTN